MLEADADAVSRIEQQNTSPWSTVALLSELQQERGIVIVAELDAPSVNGDRVVGWCGCRYFAPEAELMKIAVQKDMRKLGIASSLLNSLCNSLSNTKVEALFLEVRSKNQSALNFYIKNGFLQIGERAGYYSNPVDVALLFQKDIDIKTSQVSL